jgi:hypothetical protein
MKKQMRHVTNHQYHENGVPGVHHVEALVEFDGSGDHWWREYKVVEILMERGRPSFGQTPTGGAVLRTLFGNTAMMARMGFHEIEEK